MPLRGRPSPRPCGRVSVGRPGAVALKKKGGTYPLQSVFRISTDSDIVIQFRLGVSGLTPTQTIGNRPAQLLTRVE